jgi:Flp pilus assembly protein TadG
MAVLRRHHRKLRREGGQGTVEMVLTLFAFFTILFMYVQIALSFSVANYIQYATFMAARAFLSAHPSEGEQKRAAASVLDAMLRPGGSEVFGSIAKPSEGTGDIPGATIGATSRVELRATNSRRKAWEQGVQYKFKTKLYMVPLIRPKPSKDGSGLELISETYLGREPTADECVKYLKKRQTDLGIQKPLIFDNGC